MTNDVTSLVIEAQEARARMQEAKRRIKDEVRRKYEAQMRREIADLGVDAEAEFARVLAKVHAAGVPQAVLRREVLRTNVWHIWTYWRDLAEIEPERVSARAAKESKARQGDGLEWSEDYKTLTFTHDGKGNPLIRPVVLPTDPAKKGRDGYYRATFPDKATDPEGFEAWTDLMDTFPGGIVEFYRKMSDEIEKQVAAGNVEVKEK